MLQQRLRLSAHDAEIKTGDETEEWRQMAAPGRTLSQDGGVRAGARWQSSRAAPCLGYTTCEFYW